MRTRKPSSSRTKKSRPSAKKRAQPTRKGRTAKPVVKKIAVARAATVDVDELKEELAEARAELARIAGEENHARRDLETQLSLGRTVEERLQAELDAMRLDLRTALADLEIARADHRRAEAKLLETMRELQVARENERLASHASADAREKLLDVERDNVRLRRELAAAQQPAEKASG